MLQKEKKHQRRLLIQAVHLGRARRERSRMAQGERESSTFTARVPLALSPSTLLRTGSSKRADCIAR